MNWPWNELGLDGPASLTEVRRAYARRLQEVHPEENPEDFQRLHDAYQEARRAAKAAQQTAQNPSSGAEAPATAPAEPTAQPDQKPAPQAAPEPPKTEPPQASQADWDYDALLEEGDQEEQTRQANAHTEEERWTAVDQALGILYQFWRDQYPQEMWHHFLYSRLFFRVKGDPDFLVGLEEFILDHPDLEMEVRREIWDAYGLGQRHVPALYQPLRRCLSGEENRQERNGQKKKRKTGLFLVVLALAVLVGGVTVRKLHRQREYAELAHWIQEDFQRPIGDKLVYSEEELYVPDDAPELLFSAWRTGKRDLTAGNYGYETNFSTVMLEQALSRMERLHAKYWKMDKGSLHDDLSTRLLVGQVYQLDTLHAEMPELLAELDRTLNKLETTEAGYALFPPVCTVLLSYRGLTWYSWTMPEEHFDRAAAQEAYDNLPFQTLAYDVEVLGIAEEDFGDVEVTFTSGGCWEDRTEHFPKEYVVVHAEPADGANGRWYILKEPFSELYDVPEDRFSPATAQRDLAALPNVTERVRSIASFKEQVTTASTLYRG